MPAVADLLVSRLRAAGVRMLFGVPGGGSNLDVIEAAGRQGLPFVLTATETAAALAAMAQAEITGAPGACLTTLGPGVSSVVNGVACAFLDRAPVVVLTDAQAWPEGFSHQRLDHTALLGSVTKMSIALTDASSQDELDRAIDCARQSPRGPVHFDCAWHSMTSPPPASGRQARVVTRMSELEALVARSRKPLVIAGLEARGADDVAAIRRLCDRCGVPAMVSYKGKGIIPDESPWFAGVFTNAAVERPIAGEADLLIGLGLDPVELIQRPWTLNRPIVYCGPGVQQGQVPFADERIGSVASAARVIESSLTRTDWDLQQVRRKVDAARASVRTQPSDVLTPDRVVDIAAGRLAATHRVTVDAGAHMFPATMLWPVSEPNGMLISNGLSTMGFALPAAIGAALLDRERPVVALTGDGGLLMCVGELLTAAREKLRLIVVVFNDRSLSLIEIKQQARRLEPAGVALGDTRWTTLAESFGLAAFRAETADELGLALEMAHDIDGPSLVEATIDRSNYGATLRAIRG